MRICWVGRQKDMTDTAYNPKALAKYFDGATKEQRFSTMNFVLQVMLIDSERLTHKGGQSGYGAEAKQQVQSLVQVFLDALEFDPMDARKYLRSIDNSIIATIMHLRSLSADAIAIYTIVCTSLFPVIDNDRAVGEPAFIERLFGLISIPDDDFQKFMASNAGPGNTYTFIFQDA